MEAFEDMKFKQAMKEKPLKFIIIGNSNQEEFSIKIHNN